MIKTWSHPVAAFLSPGLSPPLLFIFSLGPNSNYICVPAASYVVPISSLISSSNCSPTGHLDPPRTSSTDASSTEYLRNSDGLSCCDNDLTASWLSALDRGSNHCRLVKHRNKRCISASKLVLLSKLNNSGPPRCHWYLQDWLFWQSRPTFYQIIDKMTSRQHMQRNEPPLPKILTLDTGTINIKGLPGSPVSPLAA